MKQKLVFLLIVLLLVPASSTYAASWYAGVNKPGSTYMGIQAKIKTPTSLPALGDSGESCWVTNVRTNSSGVREWVQTGIRYYNGYAGFRTYVETSIGGVYNMNEVGGQVLNFDVQYQVSYQPDGNWHAFIAGYDKGGWSMGTAANVQAQGESHAQNTVLGPFVFSYVYYADSGSTWRANDTAPTAQTPYKVDVYSNSNYKVYGP